MYYIKPTYGCQCYVTEAGMFGALKCYTQKNNQNASIRGRSLLSTVDVATFIRCLSNILQTPSYGISVGNFRYVEPPIFKFEVLTSK